MKHHLFHSVTKIRKHQTNSHKNIRCHIKNFRIMSTVQSTVAAAKVNLRQQRSTNRREQDETYCKKIVTIKNRFAKQVIREKKNVTSKIFFQTLITQFAKSEPWYYCNVLLRPQQQIFRRKVRQYTQLKILIFDFQFSFTEMAPIFPKHKMIIPSAVNVKKNPYVFFFSLKNQKAGGKNVFLQPSKK